MVTLPGRTSSLYYSGLASQLYYSEVEFLQKDTQEAWMDHTRLVNNEARSHAYARVQFWSECERLAVSRINAPLGISAHAGLGLLGKYAPAIGLCTAMITAVLARQCQIA